MVLFVLFNFRNQLRLRRTHILDRGSEGSSPSRDGNTKYSDAEQPRSHSPQPQGTGQEVKPRR